MITAIKNGEAVALWRPMLGGRNGTLHSLAVKQGKIKIEELPENKREWIAETILITQENIDWYIGELCGSALQSMIGMTTGENGCEV